MFGDVNRGGVVFVVWVRRLTKPRKKTFQDNQLDFLFISFTSDFSRRDRREDHYAVVC
jgi:hypothetical protein